MHLKKTIVLALIPLVAWVAGCSAPQPTSTGSPKPQTPSAATSSTPASSTATPSKEPQSEKSPGVSLSDDETKRAEQLASQVKNRVFPYAEQNKKENAKVFLFLAATSKDEQVTLASLDGMTKTWTAAEGNAQKEKITDDYVIVIKKLLESGSNPVLAYSIEAAKPAVAGPSGDPALVEKLTSLADTHKEASARLEALNALAQIKDFQQKEKIAAVFLKNLDAPEAHLKSLALFRIQFNNYNLVRKPDFYAKAKSLMKDPDPGVRGRAVEVASVLVPDAEKQTLGAQITEMLGDKQGYVRSACADALGRLGYKPAIPKLVALLDDKTSNTHDIKYTKLSGQDGSEHHDGSAWSRVDDSILWSLSQLTFEMGDQKFRYGKIDYKNVDADVAREVALAKAWYAKNKDSLK